MNKDIKDITDMGLILDVVSDYYKMDRMQIFKKTRKRNIVLVRQMFYYMCRKNNPDYIVGLGLIGKYYSDVTKCPRDHATVLHACNKIKDLMDVYDSVLKMEKDISLLIERKKEGSEYQELDAIDIMMSIL